MIAWKPVNVKGLSNAKLSKTREVERMFPKPPTLREVPSECEVERVTLFQDSRFYRKNSESTQAATLSDPFGATST